MQQILQTQEKLEGKMIPKIYHQIWLGENPLPKKYKKWQEEWRALHHDWEYFLWTDDNTPDEAKKYMDLNPVLACKSSVLRAYVVMKHGGVYTDTDCEWNKNIDELLDNRAFVGRVPAGHIGNAVFAAEKNHPMLLWQWEKMPKYAIKNPPWGPKFITEAVNIYKNIVTVYPKKYFFPRSWQEPKVPAKNFPNSYLVHSADKLW